MPGRKPNVYLLIIRQGFSLAGMSGRPATLTYAFRQGRALYRRLNGLLVSSSSDMLGAVPLISQYQLQLSQTNLFVRSAAICGDFAQSFAAAVDG